MSLKGMDISYYQGNVDFAKVKKAGIQFAIFRAGYGQTMDSKLVQYADGARKAGLPILGLYHFIYVHQATAAQNAEALFKNAQKAGLDPKNTWLYADLEYDTWTKLGKAANKAGTTKYVKEFLDTLKAKGCRKLGIYTNADYYVHYLDWNTLKEYRDHLWLADLKGGPDYQCSIQQYSFTGRVNGINCDVDLDELFDESMMPGNSDGGEYEDMTQAQMNTMVQQALLANKATLQAIIRETIAADKVVLTDKDAGDWSKAARDWSVSSGLIQGTGRDASGNMNYAWLSPLDRQQLVTVLYRFAQQIGKA